MFHTVSVSARSRTGLSRHYPGASGEVNWKAPLRCGILFCTLSCVLAVIGIILTWLGGHDVFGESVPITGPILLSVGGLMSLLALRQFYLANGLKKRDKISQAKTDKEKEALAEEEANLHTEDETFKGEDDDPCSKPDIERSHNHATRPSIPYNRSHHHPSLSLANHNPYYCMAMMVYKDPALTYAPFLATQMSTESYPGDASSAPNSPNPQDAPCTSSSLQEEPHSPAERLPSTSSVGGDVAGVPSSPLSENEDPASLPGTPTISATDSAVLQTPSTTLPYHCRPAVTKTISAPVYSSAVYPVGKFSDRKYSESHKHFPSDLLGKNPIHGSSGVTANAGIHNLPKPTAFMMLQTLEIQETI